jgi:predicted permease
VSGNYFAVLGVTPAIGRAFLPEEGSLTARDIVALVSYENWQASFHSDPHIEGTRIKVNGQPVTIIGVLPVDFRGMGTFIRPDYYLPVTANDRLFPSDTPLAKNYNSDLAVYGRLKRGVSAKAAQAEFTALAQRVEQPATAGEPQRRAVVLPVVASRMAANPDDVKLVFLLLGIAGMVLAVGCLNVANLLLGRASARVKEITIRQSIGASRGRLIAQLLTESVVLAGVGAAAGLLVSYWAIHYFASVSISPDFPSHIPARMDARVLTYTLLAAAASVVVSSLWPAIRATRVDLAAPAKGAGGHSFRGRRVLVATQTALAAILLVTAALFVKSFFQASSDNPGFRVKNVLAMSFNPSVVGLRGERMRTFYQNLEDQVNALPGVRSASLGSHLPMGSDSQWNSVAPEGVRESISLMYDRVEPGYFATMAVPILAGRSFEEGDKPGAPAVAIVNEALARRLWPNENAAGKRIRFGEGPRARVLEIVGIAGNGKYQGAVDKYEPYIYIPYRQLPIARMTLFVYTAGDPAAMSPAVREVAKSLGPDIPIGGVHTMQEFFDTHGMLGARLMAQLVGAMGAIGLTLGVLGVYAVVAFVVSRRTRELGIRMALGATAGSVLRGVLASGARVALAGIAIGLAGAFALTRYFTDFLDRVSPRDPMVFSGVAIFLLSAALAACWAPARRASRVDPAVTLRYD